MQKEVKRKRSKTGEPTCVLGVNGMFRVNIVNPDGSIAGDSGWKKNVLTNAGLHSFILGRALGNAGSQGANYFVVGSGNTSISTAATSLPGNLTTGSLWVGVTTATTSRAAYSDAATAQYTATFASNTFGASTTVGCAGLNFTTSGGSSTALLCGATFASSTVATNQAINCTYNLLFAATVTNN